MTGKGLLRCRIGGNEFALRAHDVRYVVRADQMRAEEAPDARRGALTLGGQQVPVFAMSSALGLPRADESTHADQHIAVTGDANELVGWLVDRLGRTAADGRITALPSSIGGQARRWFEGVVTFAEGEAPILLVSPRQLDPIHPPIDSPLDQGTFDEATVVETISSTPPVALIFSTSALPSSITRRFALSGRQVAAITQPVVPIAVPGSARHIAGLTLWRNTIVPVLDFREASGRSGTGDRQLIARCKSDGRASLVALAIDSDVAMHRPDAENRCRTGLECPPFTSGLFDVDGEVVALLDVDALVAG